MTELMGADHDGGCFICPKCGEHVKFSQAEFHPCPIDKARPKPEPT